MRTLESIPQEKATSRNGEQCTTASQKGLSVRRSEQKSGVILVVSGAEGAHFLFSEGTPSQLGTLFSQKRRRMFVLFFLRNSPRLEFISCSDGLSLLEAHKLASETASDSTRR
ncbi:hypothetical protein CDAR_603601 [Caerostris darwini]|uniref:Uncharacterized protein n=1 Tax=Caerostris darwini TaxID=1538125 RepID=A0AAV4T6P3_9ARAC|nr:hypothetical protein CDAR_603601 [Caerostris darwini]